MFGYSMVKMVQTHAYKLDRPLRKTLLNLYKPFKWTPSFLHVMLEGWVKNSKRLELIVEFEKSETSFETALHELNDIASRHWKSGIKQEFSLVSCVSAEITPSALEEMLESCSWIKKVYLNREVHALLDVAVPSANAKNIERNGTTLTGKGVTIAIIDTGIYSHNDLQGRIIDFVDFINQKTEPYDDNGHGTHCAGVAAGNGAASLEKKYMGPAPEANVIGVKVLNKLGSGSLETVMKGIDWCIKYNEDTNNTSKIDIISMSLGSSPEAHDREDDDPMVQYVELAWSRGIVVCVAAGNEGPEAQTIASPGISNQIITVGALDDLNTTETREHDHVASFSSRGPTLYGISKPDILAPGVNIISLRSPNSYLDKVQKSSRVGSDYFVLSGTSMATPICAGIAALVLQTKPDATPNEVKELLKNGAVLSKERNPNIYGAGYINAENSIP
ncbi:serine protease [Bacillus sp. SA1-12]|uniref:S8 family peptidase n=1 Tax=Bacillus sp. SA1-12 TaxID=1455638 RepID=UPI0006252FD8|nr:S8 family peptidase [Bacillus sp. SA1-12]KKI91683.1 serine protease [Bacillus sp. SA1-12]